MSEARPFIEVDVNLLGLGSGLGSDVDLSDAVHRLEGATQVGGKLRVMMFTLSRLDMARRNIRIGANVISSSRPCE